MPEAVSPPVMAQVAVAGGGVRRVAVGVQVELDVGVVVAVVVE